MRTIWAALWGGGLLIAVLSGTGVSTAPVVSAAPGESGSVSAEPGSPDGDDTDGERDRADPASGPADGRSELADGTDGAPGVVDAEEQHIGAGIDDEPRGVGVDGDESSAAADDEERGVGAEDEEPGVVAEDEEPGVVAEDADIDSAPHNDEPATHGVNADDSAEKTEFAESNRSAGTPETVPSIAGKSEDLPAATEQDAEGVVGWMVAESGAVVETLPEQAVAIDAAEATEGEVTDNEGTDSAEDVGAIRGSTSEATATTSLTMSAVAPSPPRSTLLSLVGSVVLNLVVGLIQLVDGPPVLPANSTVTVRTSSLDLPIGAGRSVQADWYFPEHIDETTRFVYLQHGFLASGPMYSYTAADLAERTNSIVVAPSLSSNFFAPDAAWVGGSTMQRAVAELFVGERTALTESVRAAAGWDIELPDDFVLVGHSAGGTLVVSAAGRLVGTGAFENLRGVVMLDGVEPAASPAVRQALGKLTGASDKPIYLISSERYFWSRGGDMADKLELARPDRFNGVSLDGGLHIDYMEGGNRFIQFMQYLIGGFSRAANVQAAGLIAAGWVNDLFAGSTESGIYGRPDEEITIDTADGAATARILPLGYPSRPVWPPLLEAALTAIFDAGGKYLFVYEPLPGFVPASPETSPGLRLGPQLTAQ